MVIWFKKPDIGYVRYVFPANFIFVATFQFAHDSVSPLVKPFKTQPSEMDITFCVFKVAPEVLSVDSAWRSVRKNADPGTICEVINQMKHKTSVMARRVPVVRKNEYVYVGQSSPSSNTNQVQDQSQSRRNTIGLGLFEKESIMIFRLFANIE